MHIFHSRSVLPAKPFIAIGQLQKYQLHHFQQKRFPFFAIPQVKRKCTTFFSSPFIKWTVSAELFKPLWAAVSEYVTFPFVFISLFITFLLAFFLFIATFNNFSSFLRNPRNVCLSFPIRPLDWQELPRSFYCFNSSLLFMSAPND